MDVWQSFARISGVAFQVFAAVLIGILAGVGIDHLVPAIGSVGVLVGGAFGSAAAVYLMVTGLRAYVAAEGPPPKVKATDPIKKAEERPRGVELDPDDDPGRR